MKHLHYDAIILPGGGVRLDGSIDAAAEDRLDKAIQLYDMGDAQPIVVCGSHGYKGTVRPVISEARAYANYLEGKGVASDDIYLESESQETLGNFLFAKMNIIMHHEWRSFLVIPTQNQTTERIAYLLQKIFGQNYDWEILRVGENKDQANLAREAKALRYTMAINGAYADGDHEAIYRGLMESHPAYGGTKWTIDELREELS
ncbi:MAG: hypothetical protein UY35_C0003G0056 [Candidatus Saccharibacteria bacterium GW2011_GWC2_48_9]|nr:MAG: hypothetical protein UY35_C0003G0056 [Candidatus Saccharibacteria bacterium GW2011_GWC2_48_9]HCH34115.1 hypothetical protein [Candidatus Saccharibacteria bacterium]